MAASPTFPTPSLPVDQLTETASAWRGVTLTPHPDRAVAFQLDDATIGMVHHDGLLEVPVPRSIKAALGDIEWMQRCPARSGDDWVAVRLQPDDDIDAAALLLRLAYLYRRLLRSRAPSTLRRIRIELAQYDLPNALNALYETMLAKREADSSALPDAPSTS